MHLTPEGVSSFFDWSQAYFGIGIFGIGTATRVLSIAPLNFDLSLLELWSVLDAGGEVILADPERSANKTYLGNLCVESRPEIVQAVPLFHDKLCSYFAAESKEPIPAPRHMIATGEATSRALRGRMARIFPDTTFHNLYGSTETNDSFVLSLPAADFAEPKKLGIGFPIPGVGYRIVEEQGSPGEGELQTTTPLFLLEATQMPSRLHRRS